MSHHRFGVARSEPSRARPSPPPAGRFSAPAPRPAAVIPLPARHPPPPPPRPAPAPSRPHDQLAAARAELAAEATRERAQRPRPQDPLAKARAELAAEARKRAEAAEAESRARRLRDEEQRALMARLDRMPAAERARFLEEEKIVARGRELAARWRREGMGKNFDCSIFGIEVEAVDG